MASGAEVRVLDAAARGAAPQIRDIVREAESFGPAIIGMSLFTRWVWHAYRLLDELAGRGSWTLVAGGAHATVCPEETLARGFDVALCGEAEQSLVRLVAALTFAGSAIAGGAPLGAELTGANEPSGGDPDGSGTFSATFNPGTGEVCFAYEVTGVEPLLAAHIHVAPAGIAGPVVIPMPPSSAPSRLSVQARSTSAAPSAADRYRWARISTTSVRSCAVSSQPSLVARRAMRTPAAGSSASRAT